jgi:hypothetical protein
LSTAGKEVAKDVTKAALNKLWPLLIEAANAIAQWLASL